MGSLEFSTVLASRGPGTAIVLDDDQVATIGAGAKRFPVAATINGFTWRTTVARMGGEYLLGLSREVRDGAGGVMAGDAVSVLVALDTDPRTVEAPADLIQALGADRDARERFDALAFTHRKEYVRWITEAKRSETREKRVAATVQMLHEGKTRS